MSWNVCMLGTQEKVRAACEEQFEKQAQHYAGKEEEQDIITAKARALSMIDELDLKPDPWSPHSGYGVSIVASGSRSSYDSSIKVEVRRVILVV